VRLTYHLTPRPYWEGSDPSAPYTPEAFSAEGFVHCTDGIENVVAVANRYYAGDPRPHVVLTIDLDRITAPVRYEDASRIYPHVYGAIERAAIVAVADMARRPDGRFGPPPPLPS
jgi:uncharacterized protein (DUF952 family)